MTRSFEGDLIRPLGEVTLCFGYVEAEITKLVEALREAGVNVDTSPFASLGQRLAAFGDAIRTLPGPAAENILALLAESFELIDSRNSLIHAGLYAGGRVKPNDPSKPEYTITPEKLTTLAERALNWKERLWSTVHRELLPTLRGGAGGGLS